MATPKDSALAHRSTEEQKLAKLEEKLRHEIMDDDERQRLRDEIMRLRRREEAQ